MCLSGYAFILFKLLYHYPLIKIVLYFLNILLYMLVQYEPVRQDGISLFSALFWIVLPAISIYVVIIGGSKVNNSVSLPLENISCIG